MEEIIVFLKECIQNALGEKLKMEITDGSELKSLGVNSISFMSIVVAAEDKYDIEFEDERLLDSFNDVRSLAEYVEQLRESE